MSTIRGASLILTISPPRCWRSWLLRTPRAASDRLNVNLSTSRATLGPDPTSTAADGGHEVVGLGTKPR
jgi:hypothetical protein